MLLYIVLDTSALYLGLCAPVEMLSFVGKNPLNAVLGDFV